MSRASGFGNIMIALRHRDFAIFTYAHLPGLVAMWAQRAGVGWLAWDLTQSPVWLGVIAMADLLPAVFLAPIGGALADRVNVIKLFIYSETAVVAHSVLLWLLTVTGIIDIWLLFLLALLLGCNNPFGNASRANLVPLLVPHAALAPAIALNAISFNAARTVGPATAGIMIAWLDGVNAVFALAAVSEAILLVSLFFLRTKPQPRMREGGGVSGMVRDVRAGFGYVLAHAGIGPVLLLLAFGSVTTRPSLELLPGFADQIFGRGPEGFGWLGAAIGIGGILSSVWLAWRGGIEGLANLVVLHTSVMAAALFVFGIADAFWVAWIALGVVGFSLNAAGVGTQTLLQWSVDPAMRGRVMSIFMLIFRGMPALGALVIGLAAEYLGLQWTVAAAAVACAVGCLWAYRQRAAMAQWLEKPGSRSDGDAAKH